MNSKKGSLAWDSLKCELHPWIKEAITSLGFPTMTPVQASTIPLFSANKDVVVEAVTGSGKTLAFVLPVLQKVSNILYGDLGGEDEGSVVKKGHFLAVVVSPTRELALQTQRVFDSVIQFLPEDKKKIKSQLLIGSVGNVRENIEDFRKTGPQILIGTPGRLLEFLSSDKVKTNSVEIAVLDEADRLLDMSFEQEVLNVLKCLPNQRRTGLFSATISAAGDTIFRTGMSNPVKIVVKSAGDTNRSAPTSLSLNYMMVNPEEKISVFLKLIKDYNFKKCMVYFPTCISVKYFQTAINTLVGTDELNAKFHILHGQLSTSSRFRILQSFTDGDSRLKKHVLMATDVAARGIDVPDIDLVIQLDPPTDPAVFLHRCGRAGRANKVGQAIVMLNENSREEDFVDFMEVKGVIMNEMECPDVKAEHAALYEKWKKYILADRARHESAIRSYVGFIRYYSNHSASSIFRLQTLDYLGVARMYGLLRLPKMPESRNIPDDVMPEDGWLIPAIDMDKYAYADPKKEKERLETLEEVKLQQIQDAKARKLKKVKNEAWSSKKDSKDTRQDRKEKAKRKREAIEQQIQDESSDDDETQVDWKELVQQNKKKKSDSNMQGSFDDL